MEIKINPERVEIMLTDMEAEKRQAVINRKKVENECRKSYYRGTELALEYTIDMIRKYLLKGR